MNGMTGRELPEIWKTNTDIWNRIDMAVDQEQKRTAVAEKFLPLHGPVPRGEYTYPSDRILNEQPLRIEEPDTVNLIELVVEMTEQQVANEIKDDQMTAVTLATRAGNHLIQAVDVVIFQGQSAIAGPNQHPLFRDRKVLFKSGSRCWYRTIERCDPRHPEDRRSTFGSQSSQPTAAVWRTDNCSRVRSLFSLTKWYGSHSGALCAVCAGPA
jgi:hypothetical protein